MAWTTPSTYVAGAILTAASLNTNVRDNTNALYSTVQRLGYQARTSSYTTTSAVAPGPTNIFATSISWTADGTSAYLLEFYSPSVSTSSTAGSFVVTTFTTNTGTSICYATQSAFGDGTRQAINPNFARYLYTPAAGTATFNVRAYHGTAAGVVDAGAGGNAIAPMYMAVYGPPLA
jgi:hypothetical protein